MLLIFGTRAYLTLLAMVQFVCPTCHANAAQRVIKQVTRFTLFFIPTFSVGTKYLTECTNCGATIRITPDQADEYARAPRLLPPVETAPFEQVAD